MKRTAEGPLTPEPKPRCGSVVLEGSAQYLRMLVTQGVLTGINWVCRGRRTTAGAAPSTPEKQSSGTEDLTEVLQPRL